MYAGLLAPHELVMFIPPNNRVRFVAEHLVQRARAISIHPAPEVHLENHAIPRAAATGCCSIALAPCKRALPWMPYFTR